MSAFFANLRDMFKINYFSAAVLLTEVACLLLFVVFFYSREAVS